jgi:hypothetical protein
MGPVRCHDLGTTGLRGEDGGPGWGLSTARAGLPVGLGRGDAGPARVAVVTVVRAGSLDRSMMVTVGGGSGVGVGGRTRLR